MSQIGDAYHHQTERGPGDEREIAGVQQVVGEVIVGHHLRGRKEERVRKSQKTESEKKEEIKSAG